MRKAKTIHGPEVLPTGPRFYGGRRDWTTGSLSECSGTGLYGSQREKITWEGGSVYCCLRYMTVAARAVNVTHFVTTTCRGTVLKR